MARLNFFTYNFITLNIRSYIYSVISCSRASSYAPPICSDGLGYFLRCCRHLKISENASKALLNSVSESTKRSYLRYWRQFAEFAEKKGGPLQISIPLICDFLLYLFNVGLSSSSLNIVRSSLSFFCLNIVNVTDNVIVSRLFKYFYNSRPLRPRYYTYWSVEKLLSYLKVLHPIENLNLKQLTLKTLALIALSSSDRGQTLHLLKVNNLVIEDNEISFVIFDKLKHTRKVAKPKIVRCPNSEIPALNVALYVRAYMAATEPMRNECTEKGLTRPTELFLSWATRKPVTRATLSRWLVSVLNLAGIDTSRFKAHSFRGAGLSAAHKKGASIDKIVQHGNWKNVNMFHSYYHAPEEDSSIGQIIMRHSEVVR